MKLVEAILSEKIEVTERWGVSDVWLRIVQIKMRLACDLKDYKTRPYFPFHFFSLRQDLKIRKFDFWVDIML